MIPFEDFAKIELKVGTVLEAEDIEGSEKLIKLKVDLGPLNVTPVNSSVIPAQAGTQKAAESDGSVPTKVGIKSGMTQARDIRQILVGVKQWYKAKDFVGKQVVVAANLAPRTMMGLQSQGMMLAADSETGPVFLTVPKEVPAGTKVR